MARGWESKAVADQIEEGESRPASRTKAQASPEQRQLKERLDSLRLSKSRLLQQLERARHPAHRNVLLNGLKAVEKEIEEVIQATQATDATQATEATEATLATDAAQATEAAPPAEATDAILQVNP
jgi:hypothetical protein